MLNNTNNEIFKRMIIENKMQKNNTKTITKDNENSNDNNDESDFSLILKNVSINGITSYYKIAEGYSKHNRIKYVWAYFNNQDRGEGMSELWTTEWFINNEDKNKSPLHIGLNASDNGLHAIDNIYYNTIKCRLVDPDGNVIKLNNTSSTIFEAIAEEHDKMKYIKDNGTNCTIGGDELYILILTQ